MNKTQNYFIEFTANMPLIIANECAALSNDIDIELGNIQSDILIKSISATCRTLSGEPVLDNVAFILSILNRAGNVQETSNFGLQTSVSSVLQSAIQGFSIDTKREYNINAVAGGTIRLNQFLATAFNKGTTETTEGIRIQVNIFYEIVQN